MSKFKHVTGFGFEAETWDEKQVEAAQLVDQLSQCVGGIKPASRIGSVAAWTVGFRADKSRIS